ncbi:MAG: SGNH/GDSL hydrolase family protein [Prolixibacteraceae bacterium]
MEQSRRDFIMNSAVKVAGVAGIPMILAATMPSKKKQPEASVLKDKDIILFQGDSITDAGRARNVQKANDPGALGHGYALLAAAALLEGMPEKDLTVFNRGISGNKVYQLAERWQEDCLDLKPGILSILIGVNDYWHKRNGNYDGNVDVYKKDYRALLIRTRKVLPDATIIICEPFSVEGGTAIGGSWQEEFEAYRKVAASLSREFGTLFIPYHTIFTEALKYAPAAYWSPDGVHPSLAGAQLMASSWLSVVK